MEAQENMENNGAIPFSPTMKVDMEDRVFKDFFNYLLNVIREPFNQTVDSVFTYTNMSSVQQGIFWISPEIIVSLSYDESWTAVIVSLETRSLLYNFTFDAVNSTILSSMDSEIGHGIVDLSQSGRRWEGEVCNDKPCGYGILYNDHGNIEYNGFYVNGVKECYGISYFDDIEIIKYQGNYCKGNRFGIGFMGDLHGEMSKEIIFVNDAIADSFKNTTISSELSTGFSILVENLVIKDMDEWATTYFPFNQFRNLKSLEVGQRCFMNVEQVFLTDMMNLESVRFGDQAFSEYSNAWNEDILHTTEFVVRNCPNLRQMVFNPHAFSDYYICSISNLPSLHSLLFGSEDGMSDCFTQCPRLVLEGFPELEKLHFGGQSFFGVEDVKIRSGDC